MFTMCIFSVSMVFSSSSHTSVTFVAKDATRMVDALAGAVEAIHSYDVQMNVSRRHLVRYEQQIPVERDRKALRSPGMRILPLREGESPEVVNSKIRQVWTSDDRRRTDQLSESGTGYTAAQIYDGEFVVSSSRSAGQLSVRQGHSLNVLPLHGEAYESLYKRQKNGETLIWLFRERLAEGYPVKAMIDGSHVILSSPPGETRANPSLGLRVWLDLEHGSLPSRIQTFSGNMETLASDVRISRFREIDQGVWVPLEATYDIYSNVDGVGNMRIQSVSLLVDEQMSRWNHDIGKDVFSLHVNKGTQVHDEVRGLSFIAGSPNTSEHLDALLDDARVILRYPTVSSPEEPIVGRRLFVVFVLMTIVFFAGIFVLRWLNQRLQSDAGKPRA